MRVAIALAVAALIVPSPARSGPLETGRAKLFARDYTGAMLDLDAAIAAPPEGDDEEAHALRSVARLAELADAEAGPDPAFLDTVKEMLGAFGFAPEQRSLLDWEVDAPRDAAGRLALAADSPTGGEVQDFLLDPVVLAIEASIDDLTHVSAAFSTVVTGAEVTELLASLDRSLPNHAEDETFAHGEWKLWEVALRLAHAKLLLAVAYDLDVDIDELLDPDFVMAVQANVLDPHPNLLTIASGGPAALLGVRSDLFAAIDAYGMASASMRARGRAASSRSTRRRTSGSCTSASGSPSCARRSRRARSTPSTGTRAAKVRSRRARCSAAAPRRRSSRARCCRR